MKNSGWRTAGTLIAALLVYELGKLTARERLELLFDEGTFVEYGTFAIPGSSLHGIDRRFAPGDGVVTGFGKVDGRLVWAVSQDFTVLGGSMGQNHCRKINRASEEAARNGCPCVYFWDGGGGRLQEAWFDELYKCTILASKNSGYIPTVSVICGPCAGGSAYAPILNDFLICVDRTSKLYLCGPSVIRSATGEAVSEEELARLYAECKIVVVPLRYGAGVKGKVVEAIYNGAPIVTTSIGAEGIPQVETVLRAADEPEEFAAEVAALYQDNEACRALCQKTQRYIRQHFSMYAAWKGIEEDFRVEVKR